MHFGFSYIGLIWLSMLFVPNFIWTKNKPKDYEEYADEYGLIYVAMEGCGHSPQSQHPDQFADIIREFLLDVD